MKFSSAWDVLRRSAILIIVCLLIGIAGGVAYLRLAPAKYTARADVYVSASGSASVTELNASALFAQQQAKNFSLIVTRERVVTDVIERLRLRVTREELARSVTATVPATTSIISVTVTQPSPNQAAAVANAFADALRQVATELLPPARRGGPAIQIQSVQIAEPPTSPSSPRLATSLVLGGGLGLLVGLGIAFVRDATRSSRRPRQAAGSRQPSEVTEMVGS